MLAGCDFVCKNEKCEYRDTGFVMTGPWPLGDIDDIINSEKVKNTALENELNDLKESGRQFACIVFPNKGKVEYKKYRVQMWSEEAKCIWTFEVDKNGDEYSKTPDICPKTKCQLTSFNEAISSGIKCPCCSVLLDQKKWMVNEE